MQLFQENEQEEEREREMSEMRARDGQRVHVPPQKIEQFSKAVLFSGKYAHV
jgi:hypothetical protein